MRKLLLLPKVTIVSRRFPGRSVRPLRALRPSLALLRAYVARRRSRPRLAQIGLPVMFIAVVLSTQYWALFPLMFGIWWWAPQEPWPYTWLVPFMGGWVGVEWSITGTYGLVAFPNHRLVVAAAWIGAALCLAGISALNRRYTSPGY